MSITWPLKALEGPTRKPADCHSCPLYGDGNGFGFPEQGGSNGVLVVAESLDERGAFTGLPLTGASGHQFDGILKRGGLRRDDFLGIDHVVHCRPPSNRLAGQPYEFQAINHCKPYLHDTIDRLQPRAILALGGIPLREVASQNGITRNRGFIFEGIHGIPVVGTFHPDYLLPKRRQKSASKYTWVVLQDIRKAIRVAAGGRRLYPQQYLLDPHVDRARQFLGEWNADLGPMAWDLETLYSIKTKNEQKLKLESKQQITRMSMAFRPGYAMTIPWVEPYLSQVILPFFRHSGGKFDWNGLGFDRPIIIFQESIEVNGLLMDGMDMFHVFQPNLERNLEFATSLLSDHLKPWKHLNQSEPEWYSAQDADATITNYYALKEMMEATPITSSLWLTDLNPA